MSRVYHFAYIHKAVICVTISGTLTHVSTLTSLITYTFEYGLCVAFEVHVFICVWGTLRMGLYLSVDIMLLVWTCCSQNGQGQIYI